MTPRMPSVHYNADDAGVPDSDDKHRQRRRSTAAVCPPWHPTHGLRSMKRRCGLFFALLFFLGLHPRAFGFVSIRAFSSLYFRHLKIKLVYPFSHRLQLSVINDQLTQCATPSFGVTTA
jgi:hypothetical protein